MPKNSRALTSVFPCTGPKGRRTSAENPPVVNQSRFVRNNSAATGVCVANLPNHTLAVSDEHEKQLVARTAAGRHAFIHDNRVGPRVQLYGQEISTLSLTATVDCHDD